MTLVRVTAPAETPITLVEAKAHLRVDGSAEDTYISGLIAAAVALCDGQGSLGRSMVTQTWAKWVPQSPGVVRVGMGPFIALTGVDYYDSDGVEQVAVVSDYEVRLDGDFVNVRPKSNKAWPPAMMRDDAIKLTFTAGFGAAADVPDGIKHALLMLVAHWYANREAVTNENLKDVPMAVDALIGNERVGWYG